MRKRDMYVNYSRSSRRRRSRRSPRNFKNLLPFLLIIVLALLLGFGAYSLAKEGKITFDIFSKKKAKGSDITDDNSNKDSLDTTNEELTDETTDNTGENKSLENQSDPEDFEGQESTDDPGSQSSEVSSSQGDREEPIRTVRETVEAKGIYVTGPVAGSEERMNELISLVNDTELNTMVIDIKNDSGEITYKMEHDLVEEIGAGINYIRDIKQLIKELKEQDIYLIARIVAFKDPMLAEKKLEFSLKNADGSLFRDKAGLGWINPYNKGVWEYLIGVSQEAIDLGFDEIQFDYIRFSTDSRMESVDFGPEAEGKSKSDIITEFTQYAYEKLSPHAYVSADVYGAIIDSVVDQEIVGQNYLEMAKHLDYICPMIYPSHYADGSYGIDHPDLEPYNLILASLEKSKEVLSQVPDGSHVAKVRSWLQDFTASWVANYQNYGPKQIRDQVEGVYDSGYQEWILWNGSNRYTKDGLLTE